MYKFREGYRAPIGLKADIAAIELERIRDAAKQLTPANIIDHSRKKSSPLHIAFEWDDSKAAQKYREKQAGDLVRAIVFEVKEHENEEVKHKYVLTRKDDTRQYMPIELVKEDKSMLSYSVSRLRAQLNGLKQSINELTKGTELNKGQRRKVAQLSKHIDKAASVAAGI